MDVWLCQLDKPRGEKNWDRQFWQVILIELLTVQHVNLGYFTLNYHNNSVFCFLDSSINSDVINNEFVIEIPNIGLLPIKQSSTGSSQNNNEWDTELFIFHI